MKCLFLYTDTSQGNVIRYFRVLSKRAANGGAKQDRTADLLRARQALSQLSYSPMYAIFKTRSRLDSQAMKLCGSRRVQPPHSLLCKVERNDEPRNFGGSGWI